MTITFRPDPVHAAGFAGACPKCGHPWDGLRPCQECGNEMTWPVYLNKCLTRGDAVGTVNALLAGVAGAQGGEAA